MSAALHAPIGCCCHIVVRWSVCLSDAWQSFQDMIRKLVATSTDLQTAFTSYLGIISILLLLSSTPNYQHINDMADNIELKPVGKSRPIPDVPPRHPDTHPGGLGAAYRAAEDKAKAAVALNEGGLDAVSIWGLVSASW